MVTRSSTKTVNIGPHEISCSTVLCHWKILKISLCYGFPVHGHGTHEWPVPQLDFIPGQLVKSRSDMSLWPRLLVLQGFYSIVLHA